MIPRAFLETLRVKAGRVAMDSLWAALAQTGRLPAARPARHGIERLDGLAYLASGLAAHTLDVYRPVASRRKEPLPVVLYLHGGGFRILSKDTHWVMGLAFARRGYVVLNANYRLAPAHPFPAAVEDSCAALLWAHANASRFGGDPSRIVLAGESAGANLATSLAIAASYERPEPYARAVFDAGVRPCAVLPACGLLAVTDVDRYVRAGAVSRFVADRLREIEDAYQPRGHDLADPLVMLERGEPSARPLPPFFAGVGGADALSEDTRRLAVALARLGVVCDARTYDGEPHAFHAFVWRPRAKALWRDTFAFLDRHVPKAPGGV
jgi:acetyl esterase